MVASYRPFWNAYLSSDEMERVRSMLLYSINCRSLSTCAPQARNVEGGVYQTGFTLERLHIGIDFKTMLSRLGDARRERLRDWCIGIHPFSKFRSVEQIQLRQDIRTCRDFARDCGYQHLLGRDVRVDG